MSRKRTSDQQPQIETPAATADPPAPEVNDNRQSFVERVGQRRRVTPADPFEFATDPLPGVRLFESRQDHQVAIKLDEKPSQAVIDKLKEAGYHWNPAHKIWAHPVHADSATSIRIDAERLYQEVRKMVRQDKGIEAGPEVPF